MTTLMPVELTEDECRDLMSRHVVGRVALSTPGGPRIVPVNYALHDNSIVFRTAPYSELGTYGWDAELAFEVDQIDEERHSGWSVVALGRGSLIEDSAELGQIRGRMDPHPWAGGSRQLYMRLTWRTLTGRRIPG
jgi:nitroimidazol reductase NimA-like FMN-containing flavoprotein (pyridoxamine 5'-phosphate oxidase superfamily)